MCILMKMTSNMYRVGDYVYFETLTTSPYVIRRIEELNKTPSGNVEAKVICFYRRRDLPASLIQLADKHQNANSDESPVAMKLKKMCLKTPAFDESPSGFLPNNEQTNAGNFEEEFEELSQNMNELQHENKEELRTGIESDLSSMQKHQIKHRELFLSRQMETLPASCIRGKCSVALLNETESLHSYLDKEDMFFYCLVFDPIQKTLLADKGEIRVGSKYQCDLAVLLDSNKEQMETEKWEKLLWTADNKLSDREIDRFLVIAKSVGTFARALDCSSSVKQPSLHMSAAASSRDITLFHAMRFLHQNHYDIAKAMCSLVPANGPILCRDELEEWSASEANLFEEALEKCGKDFHDIRQEYLPWKTVKSIVEYYYMWKTTDRYVQQKRMKAIEAESKLKQVYIPNYNKMNGNKTSSNGSGALMDNYDPNSTSSVKTCESCNAMILNQWFAWGPSNMQCKLCQTCWLYWKRYGGLKIATRVETEINEKVTMQLASSMAAPVSVQNRPFKCSVTNCGRDFKYKSHLCRHYLSSHGIVMRSGSPRPVSKTRHSFTLTTTPLIKIARKLCSNLARLKHAARTPSFAINIPAVKQDCLLKTAGRSMAELKTSIGYRTRVRGSVTEIANRIRCPSPSVPNWLILTDKNNLPIPDKIFFPKPPKGPDGSFLYDKIPNNPESEKILLNNAPNFNRKRNFDETNGFEGHLTVPPKRMNKDSTKNFYKPTREQYASMLANMNFPPTLPRHIAQINGKHKINNHTSSRSVSNRKHLINWMDAPDDVFFKSTIGSRNLRKSVNSFELKRAARKPWRPININKIFEDYQMTASYSTV